MPKWRQEGSVFAPAEPNPKAQRQENTAQSSSFSQFGRRVLRALGDFFARLAALAFQRKKMSPTEMALRWAAPDCQRLGPAIALRKPPANETSPTRENHFRMATKQSPGAHVP
jgi:aryl-alcohol dehydrogenase-like predicted oxidoreductase